MTHLQAIRAIDKAWLEVARVYRITVADEPDGENVDPYVKKLQLAIERAIELAKG